ncbi:hypothetical protein [Haloparvum sp. AD34]
MYLSPPVRRIREDPTPDEDIGLVVELDERSPESLKERVDELGGQIERELGFDAWHVVIPETSLDELCETDGLAKIETDATITLDPDAPEPTVTDEPNPTIEELREQRREE